MKNPSLVLLVLSALLPTQLFAQNSSWTGATSNLWNTASNWNPSGAPAGEALFSLTGTRAVSVDGATSVGSLRFIGDGAWTFSGSAITITGAPVSSGNRPLGIYQNNVQVTFQNEVIFANSAAVGESQLGLNNGNGFVDFAGGLRGSGAAGFALRLANSSSVAETIIRGNISGISTLQWYLNGTTLDIQAASTVSQDTNITGTGGTLKLGSATALGTGTLTLNVSSASQAALTLQATGVNQTYANSVNFNSGNANSDVGIYAISGSQDLAFSGSATLSRHATFQVAAGRRFELSGNVTGNRNLTVSGSGTTVLSGSSIAYTGTTTVTSGTLLINGTLTSQTAAVLVSGSGILGGRGTVLRNVTYQTAGGGLSPGDPTVAGGIDTLTIGASGTTKALSLLNDTQLTFDLSTAVSDKVVIFGDLTLDGVLNVVDQGVTAPGSFALMTYTGSLTNNGLVLGTMPSGWDASIQVNTGLKQVTLVVAAIPEPATLALLGLAGLALIGFRHLRTSRLE